MKGHRPWRRFVAVIAFEVALVGIGQLLLGRVPPALWVIAIGAVVIETVRLSRRLRSRAGAGAGAGTAHEGDHRAAAPGEDDELTVVSGEDVAGPGSWDDPDWAIVAAIDVTTGLDERFPHAVWFADEIRGLVDEDAILEASPERDTVDGPLGDALALQPEVAEVMREDRELVYVRLVEGATPTDLHAAAVRAARRVADDLDR